MLRIGRLGGGARGAEVAVECSSQGVKLSFRNDWLTMQNRRLNYQR